MRAVLAILGVLRLEHSDAKAVSMLGLLKTEEPVVQAFFLGFDSELSWGMQATLGPLGMPAAFLLKVLFFLLVLLVRFGDSSSDPA